jgi:hypothetical protein
MTLKELKDEIEQLTLFDLENLQEFIEELIEEKSDYEEDEDYEEFDR